MRRLLLILLCCVLAACPARKEAAGEAFQGTDVTGAAIGRDFALVDHHGVTRHLSDFKGQVVALFFGYTHCPDVCPTTMADLAQALKLLGPQGRRVQVLFVTLDPERDTLDVLKRFVPAFAPSFLGLRGEAAVTRQVARDFKIFYTRQDSDSRLGYTIDHSAGIYLFDQKGKVRVYMNYGERPQGIAHDVKLLLNE